MNILTDEDRFDLIPKITLKDEKPKTQVWLTRKDAIAYAKSIEAAVIAKLATAAAMAAARVQEREFIAQEFEALDPAARFTITGATHFIRSRAQEQKQ